MDDTDKKIAALLQDDCFLPQAEIARAVGRVTSSVNERNLQQVMETHAETFSHFVLRQRLDRAAALLVSKRNLRISEIAFLCGFSDLSYFNRTFKKRFGENPRAYRR
jgi:AraC-like DNA-binding protein